jgi:inosose dehydratase
METSLRIMQSFLSPTVQHMHLKDYNGVDPQLLGYCPLGEGKVNIPAILDVMAGRKIHGMVMGELGNDPKNPSPLPQWIW